MDDQNSIARGLQFLQRFGFAHDHEDVVKVAHTACCAAILTRAPKGKSAFDLLQAAQEKWTAGHMDAAREIAKHARQSFCDLQCEHAEGTKPWAALASGWVLAMQMETRDPWGLVGSIGRAIEALDHAEQVQVYATCKTVFDFVGKLTREKKGN